MAGKRIHAALSQRAVGEHSIYFDRYFDYPDRGWTRQGNELRVRTITSELGPTRALLTFKEPAVDQASRSKPEHETAIGDADVLVTVLTALGVEQIIAFEKRCVNYRFTAQGCDLIATVVTVPELAGQTFIELETLADQTMWTSASPDAPWGRRRRPVVADRPRVNSGHRSPGRSPPDLLST
jgi:adenylate cyclase, class 2